MPSLNKRIVAWAGLGVLCTLAPHALGQELEPRRYANTPVGMNFLGFGYVHANGNLLLDPAVAIENVDANVHIFALRYVRSLALFGRNARLSIVVPTTMGDWQAVVDDEVLRREIDGVGDVAIALDYNFVGAPALTMSEFSSYDKKTVVGATLQVRVPVGQYDRERALNLGTNRWTFVPQVGASHVMGRWTIEGIAKLWLFTANDDFWDGNRFEQHPLASLQAHAIYTLRPGFWIGAGVGLANGGRSVVNGVRRDTLQQNSRFNIIVAYPFSARQGVALTVGRSITTSSGTSSGNIGVSYQLAWGGTQ